jgi:hypothetical protein
MNMQAKRIINILVGLGVSGLTAWKGPEVTGAVIGAIMAAVTLIGTLHIIPQGAEEYQEDLEDAVKKHAPADVAAKLVKDGVVQ